MNTKVIAILVSAIAVGAIVLATGALSTPPTSPSTPAKATIYTENINSTSNTFQNSTQVNVDLLNNGNGTALLTAYYVTDPSGYQYTIKVVTGRGNIFTFTVTEPSGHHYSVDLQIGFGSVAQ